MPNTLVHIAIQVPATRAASRTIPVGWILLGCVIPDIPWILRRLAGAIAPDMSPYDLMQYSTVQGSLLFCGVLSLGLACLARRPVPVAIVLITNSFLHLLLDAIEIKPGNGVHILAPWDWELFSLAWLWPENFLISALSAFGLGLGFWLIWAESPQLQFMSGRQGVRAMLAGLALLGYLVAPIALMHGPFEADNHSVRTLHDVEQRIGRSVRLDRQRYFPQEPDHYLVTYAGERIRLTGSPLAGAERVSVEGTFIESDLLKITNIHQSQAFFRDYASVAGLLVFLAVWFRGLHRARKR